MMNCESIGVLISGYLDGELTQQDRQRVEVHVADCAACRTKLDQTSHIRSSVRQLAFPPLSREEKETMMNTPAARLTGRFGWLLIVLGALIAGGFGMWKLGEELFEDPEVPDIVTIAILGLYAGLGFLLLSAGLHRLQARRSDRYKDIEL